MERKTINYRVLGVHKIDSLISHKIAMRELKNEVDSAYLDLGLSLWEKSTKYIKVKQAKEKKFNALYAKSQNLLENLERLQEQKTKLAKIPNISGNAMDLTIIDIEKGIIKAEIEKDIEKLSEEYYKSLEKLRTFLINNATPSLSLVKGKIDSSLTKSIDDNRSKASKKISKMTGYLYQFGQIRPLSDWSSYEASNALTQRVADISGKRKEVNDSIAIQERELESFIRNVHDLSRQMVFTDKSLIPAGMKKEYKTIKRTATPRTISALKTTLDRLKQSNKTQIDLEAAKDALSKNVVYFSDKRLKKLGKMINDLSTKVDKAYQKHSKENFEVLSEKLHDYHNISNLSSAAKNFEMQLRDNQRISDEQKDISRRTHVIQGDSEYQNIKINDLQVRAEELRRKGDVDSDLYKSIMDQIRSARSTIERNNDVIESKQGERINTSIPDMYTDLDKKYTDEGSGGMKL